MRSVSPWRALLPAAVGTCLSLMGDATLYAVLPTQTATAGVAVASVGILLSANRIIRLALNGPAGMIYDRLPRRPLFVSALFIGALSTAIYGLTSGFWPLLVGRLLWGLSWSGIWVGGNTIILDISHDDSRGQWVGYYTFAFFLGASSGALLGGALTDLVGYHGAMVINAIVQFLGALAALAFLPETRGLKHETEDATAEAAVRSPASDPAEAAEFASAAGLNAVNRLTMAGILSSTLGLFLLDQIGEQVQIAGHLVGVATLTGLGLGLSRLLSMLAAPVAGRLSDRAGSRWQAAAGGLVPGIAGFALLAIGSPAAIAASVPLTAVTAGSNQSLSTALIGDMGNSGRQSRRLGVLFTIGDLASAVGPPLAYALVPWIGISSVYLLSAGVFGLAFVVSLWRAAQARRRRATAQGPA